MDNPTRIKCETVMMALGLSGTIWRAMKDNSGRPNGSTQAAYPRLPTTCSKTFDVVEVANIRSVTRARYLSRFLLPTRQKRVTEQYSNPKITKLVAGPRVLLLLNVVPVAAPIL